MSADERLTAVLGESLCRNHRSLPMPAGKKPCTYCAGVAARVAAVLRDAGYVHRDDVAGVVLHEAADALEGSVGVEGFPQRPYDFRVWLRTRADAALAAVTDNLGGES